jgi:NAD(P)-dependent dehydrogenase (short-subunit alcohol dehydrogenase family)
MKMKGAFLQPPNTRLLGERAAMRFMTRRSEEVSPPARAVVVTGASTGIGLDACRELAAHRFRVFGTVRRPEDEAALRAVGATPLLLDVTSQASIRAARDQVSALLDSALLAGLVNNAGISGAGPIELLELDEFRRMFEVNALGAVAVTQEFLPLLKEARGRIVNISSVSGRIAPPFMAPYAASKFALEAISDCMRHELYPFGIRVIVIQPGIIHTPIWKKGASRDLSPVRNTIYEKVMTHMRDGAASVDHRAMPPSRVSRAILHALTARRPAARIPVVQNRMLYRLRSLVPDRVRDRRVARYLWGST